MPYKGPISHIPQEPVKNVCYSVGSPNTPEYSEFPWPELQPILSIIQIPSKHIWPIITCLRRVAVSSKAFFWLAKTDNLICRKLSSLKQKPEMNYNYDLNTESTVTIWSPNTWIPDYGFQMVKSRDLADHLNTGHFGP